MLKSYRICPGLPNSYVIVYVRSIIHMLLLVYLILKSLKFAMHYSADNINQAISPYQNVEWII